MNVCLFGGDSVPIPCATCDVTSRFWNVAASGQDKESNKIKSRRRKGGKEEKEEGEREREREI